MKKQNLCCCIFMICTLSFMGCNSINSKTSLNNQNTVKLLFECSKELGGNPDTVKELILAGAEVDATDRKGNTPFHLTCERANLSVAKILIENGANVNAQNDMGETVIYIVCPAAPIDVISDIAGHSLFGKGAKVNMPKVGMNEKGGYLKIQKAFTKYHDNFIKFLIKAGADVNIADKRGRVPLYEAAMFERINIMEILLDAGADINSAKFKGYTPLHIACEMGQLKAVTFLVEKNANIDAVSKNKITPLWKAAGNGNIEIVKYLLDSGANKNIAGKQLLSSCTPAKIAQKQGHIDIYRLINNY